MDTIPNIIYITPPDTSLPLTSRKPEIGICKQGNMKEETVGFLERCCLFLQSGLKRLHLRKPDSNADEYRTLLDAIPSCYHPRIVIHDHFELLHEYNLCGIHINRRNPVPPTDWTGHMSVSCHSVEELAMRKREGYDSLTLSPIFDSISKQGYKAAFTKNTLLAAKANGIIDQRVIALGGITRNNINEVLSYGFGGAMMLGDAWRTPSPPIVLSIAGSDSSAGAGIQQDLKTITNHQCYGATVITAITSQNTLGVQGVMPVPANTVATQLQSVFSDLRVDAVKIGMIPNIDVAKAIVNALNEQRSTHPLPIVYDPVMMSTSGTRLMDVECIDYIAHHLMPICTLVTPNIPEADYFATHDINIPANTLVKGGHASGNNMTDTLHLCDESVSVTYTSPRIVTSNLHGTGCTLSSAIASQMALGLSLRPAVALAKQYMQAAIEGGKELTIGRGNGPVYLKHPFNFSD